MSQKNVFFFVIFVFILMLFLIIFGDKGLWDLKNLKKERNELIAKNKEIAEENLKLYTLIKRLKTDRDFVEHMLRQEFGLVDKNDIIIIKSSK